MFSCIRCEEELRRMEQICARMHKLSSCACTSITARDSRCNNGVREPLVSKVKAPWDFGVREPPVSKVRAPWDEKVRGPLISKVRAPCECERNSSKQGQSTLKFWGQRTSSKQGQSNLRLWGQRTYREWVTEPWHCGVQRTSSKQGQSTLDRWGQSTYKEQSATAAANDDLPDYDGPNICIEDLLDESMY